jgi:hypothetical protein
MKKLMQKKVIKGIGVFTVVSGALVSALLLIATFMR